ncbi:MAG: MarR family transcriptional regulator [Verrucomicrobia bacterium]|nr:MarR family transcriptional regulator [Verrucomicrobiota bacterium]
MPVADAYEFVNALLSAADALLRESQRLFRPHGLTAAQFNVLNILAESPDGLSQRELSEHLVVDRSNVTGLLDRMERAGWVKRTDHPTDRRIYQVVLTADGRRLWSVVAPLYLEALRDVTRGLNPKRMRESTQLLQSLEAGAGRWSDAAR